MRDVLVTTHCEVAKGREREDIQNQRPKICAYSHHEVAVWVHILHLSDPSSSVRSGLVKIKSGNTCDGALQRLARVMLLCK